MIFRAMAEMKKKVQIPVEGSLGLLAYGFEGLVAWRKVRQAYIKQQQQSNKENKDKKD